MLPATATAWDGMVWGFTCTGMVGGVGRGSSSRGDSVCGKAVSSCLPTAVCTCWLKVSVWCSFLVYLMVLRHGFTAAPQGVTVHIHTCVSSALSCIFKTTLAFFCQSLACCPPLLPPVALWPDNTYNTPPLPPLPSTLSHTVFCPLLPSLAVLPSCLLASADLQAACGVVLPGCCCAGATTSWVNL
jgi:hypothetical protein